MKDGTLFLEFQKQVFNIVRKIPRGKITTYRIIAEKIQNKRYVRVVGNVLNKNKDLQNIACYRVVRSSGKVGGYKKGKIEKIRLLEEDGIEIDNGRIVNFNSHLWVNI